MADYVEIIEVVTNETITELQTQYEVIEVGIRGLPGPAGTDGADASGAFTATAAYLSGAIDANTASITANDLDIAYLSGAIDTFSTNFDGLTDTPSAKVDGKVVVASGSQLVYGDYVQNISVTGEFFNELLEITQNGSDYIIEHIAPGVFSPTDGNDGTPEGSAGPYVAIWENATLLDFYRGHYVGGGLRRKLGDSVYYDKEYFQTQSAAAAAAAAAATSAAATQITLDSLAADITANDADIAAISGDLIDLTADVDWISGQVDAITQESTSVASSGGTILVSSTGAYDYNLEVADYISRTEVSGVSADLAGDIATNAANITTKRTGFVAAAGYDFNGEDLASSWNVSTATFVDSVSGAIYTASGSDSYIFRAISNVDLYSNPIFRLHYNNNSGSQTSAQLYVNTGSGLTLVAPFSISSESGWKTIELDLTNNATWKGTATQIRLDLDQGGSFGNPLLVGGVSVGHTADETRTSVEGLVGAVDLSGAGSIAISTDGQTIIISGATGGGSGATSASQLIYDQSSTGLGSNVQDAIDSLNTNISTVVKTFGYTFSTTTTDSDPGNGFLRVNSATPSAATMIFIDPIDGNSNDQSSNINKLTFGNEVVIDDGTNSYTYSVNGPIVNVTGYIKIPVGGATISGTISNSASVTFRITYSATNINVAGGIGVVTNSTSTTSIPVGGGQIVYSNVLWQNASDYNATTGIYTVPYDGLYRFNAQYRLNNVTTNLRSACYARVNGTDLIRTEWVTSQYVTPLCHGVLNLTAGDQVIVWGFYSGGSANIFTTFNSQDNLFSIMKVG